MEAIQNNPTRIRVSFGAREKRDFYSTVKERVEAHFKQARKSPYANEGMILKSLLLLFLLGGFYGAILSNLFAGLPLILLYSALGVTIGLIGFNFCHDVMHGAYFSTPKWNRFASYVFDLNGMSSFVWKITHNLHHHTYTNIQGLDGDIDKALLLRLSPHDPWRPFHRYQHFYAPFLYALVSLNWTIRSDYSCFYQELKKRKVASSDIALFFFFKLLNLFLLILLPMCLLSAPIWQIAAGYLCLHFAGGSTSAFVFQLGHIVEGVEFPELNERGAIDQPWAEHEMATTSNFATSTPLWCFLMGGLNFQLEHHLFPYICHVHYPAISPIVKKTAKEFGLPYHEQPSLWAALGSHFATLHRFGQGNDLSLNSIFKNLNF
jgi:linoleoyl-CoA desaturase